MFGNSNKVTYGIVGLGRFGYALAQELAHSGAELIVLDQNEDKISEIRELVENAYIIRNLDKKTLEESGIQNCDIAVVCIGEQMDTSILTTLNLVSLGIPKVIAKANSAEHGLILEKLGAEVVYPEKDMALRLASRLETTREIDIIQLSERINISKIQVPKRLVGVSISQANIRGQFGLNIIAIENDGQLLENILPDYEFRSEDILFLSGSKDGLMQINQWSAQ
jgi:trk system potassium uptake protein